MLRIGLEFGDTWTAAKFDLLAFVIEGNRRAHGAELVPGDERQVSLV